MKYIKHRRPILYTNLLTSCKLTAYLADINEQAEELFFRLVKQLAEKEGVTEQLKADNQMLWGAGLRWRPLPQAEAPTEPTGETTNEQYSQPCNGDCKYRVDLFLISTAAKWDNLLLGGVFKKRAENPLTKQKSNDIIPIIICQQKI